MKTLTKYYEDFKMNLQDFLICAENSRQREKRL